jgi:hypothetical protein
VPLEVVEHLVGHVAKPLQQLTQTPGGLLGGDQVDVRVGAPQHPAGRLGRAQPNRDSAEQAHVDAGSLAPLTDPLRRDHHLRLTRRLGYRLDAHCA